MVDTKNTTHKYIAKMAMTDPKNGKTYRRTELFNHYSHIGQFANHWDRIDIIENPNYIEKKGGRR